MKRLILFVSVLALVLATSLFAIFPIRTASATYFPETGHSLEGQFKDYWGAHGGLAQFGYPLTDMLAEDGRSVQYLERAVFEFWPENQSQYQVQLRLLGNILTADRQGPFQRMPGNFYPQSDQVWYFQETGHFLSHGFLNYWLGHGGLDLYGYPISEEFVETSPTDGKLYTVQYFQRNRFEYHLENNGTPYETLLGLLGSEYKRLKDKGQLPNAEPTATATPTATPTQPGPTATPTNTPQPTPRPEDIAWRRPLSNQWVDNNKIALAAGTWRYETDIDYYHAGEGRRYIIFDVTVKNTGFDELYVSPIDIYLIDHTGRQWSYESITYHFGDYFKSVTLLRGAQQTGTIAFETPDNVYYPALKFDSWGDKEVTLTLRYW